MIEGISDPVAYGLATVCFGGWILVAYTVRLLVTGKLCTGRELQEKNSRIVLLEETINSRDEQISAALGVLPQVSEVLRKLHVAASASPGEFPK